jgi:hypothetical protein
VVGDPAVAAPEDQELDELVADDRSGMRGAMAAQRMGVLAAGQQRSDLDQRASRMDDGRAGTRPPDDRRCESPLIITARAYPLHFALPAQPLPKAKVSKWTVQAVM